MSSADLGLKLLLTGTYTIAGDATGGTPFAVAGLPTDAPSRCLVLAKCTTVSGAGGGFAKLEITTADPTDVTITSGVDTDRSTYQYYVYTLA